jgi:RNA polymerase sigma-70 factor (ECF subfamily)
MLHALAPEASHTQAIYEDFHDRIYRYVLSMLHDPAEAEDLTQETFLRAYRRRDSLRDAAAEAAWLYRIATHVCLDRLRQRARRTPFESEADLDEVELPETGAPSLQQVIEQDDMSACVQRYLTDLPDSYRAVILLHDMHDLTGPEMAATLGVSLPTVKIRLHRARLKLKAALAAGCEFSHDERDVLVCEPKP